MSRRDGSVYVGRLSKHTRTRDLEDIFESYGRLLRCDIKYGSEMAYAFIDFEDRRDAEDCVKYEHGRDINGQTIIVEWAKGGKDRRMSRRSESSSQSYDECFRCRRSGHWARDCPDLRWGRPRGGGGGGGGGRRWRSPSPRRRSRSRDRKRRSRSQSRDRRRRSLSPRDRKRTRSRSGDRKKNRSRSGSPKSRSVSDERKKESRSKSGSREKAAASTSRSRSKSPQNSKSKSHSKSPRKLPDNHTEQEEVSLKKNKVEVDQQHHDEASDDDNDDDGRRSRSGSKD